VIVPLFQRSRASSLGKQRRRITDRPVSNKRKASAVTLDRGFTEANEDNIAVALGNERQRLTAP
jgi:hypothetical protein